jgi:hypothetical protein
VSDKLLAEERKKKKKNNKNNNKKRSKHNISPKLRLGDKISSTKVDREKANLENITIQTLYWKVSPHWS